MINKKAILILSAILLAFTGLNTVDAQIRKKSLRATQITTAAPAKAIEVSGVILDVYDLKGQLDNLLVLRLSDESKGLTPRDPIMTFIKDDTLGIGSYRLAETLEEAAREVDGINTLKFNLSFLEHNMRTKYN